MGPGSPSRAPWHRLAGGPGFAVYNIKDCRHPVLMANIQLPRSKGHMGAFAPDGPTYYLTQSCGRPGRACSFQNAGLRVFDIRDPLHPKEIAYYKPGAVRDGVPSLIRKLGTGRRPNRGQGRLLGALAQVGNDWELWFVSDGNGFQIVRFTDWFMAHNRSLFPGSGS